MFTLEIDSSYFLEKGGILKKPGPPYGPMDPAEKEKWLEENADRLSRLDRMSASSQNQLMGAGLPPPHDARSLSEVERTLKSLNGYHEGILEALRSAAATSHRGSNASSGQPIDRDGRSAGVAAGNFGAHRSSTASLSEELRKQLMSNNDNNSGSSYMDYGGRGGAAAAGSVDLVAAMAATLKRSSREKLDTSLAAAAVAAAAQVQQQQQQGQNA